MQHHRVRLGDILDDYCPRERRITNHAVVAMIEDEIRLTRCTTCENEHPYKEARVPPTRRKRTDAPAAAPRPADASPAPPPVEGPAVAVAAAGEDTAIAQQPDIESVRRPLIRATLKPPEGVPSPSRPAPVFTVRQTSARAYPQRNGWGNRSFTRQTRAETSSTNRHGRDRFSSHRAGGASPGGKSGSSHHALHRSERPQHRQSHPGAGQSRRHGPGKGRHK